VALRPAQLGSRAQLAFWLVTAKIGERLWRPGRRWPAISGLFAVARGVGEGTQRAKGMWQVDLGAGKVGSSLEMGRR
jgi:hypothetical protein